MARYGQRSGYYCPDVTDRHASPLKSDHYIDVKTLSINIHGPSNCELIFVKIKEMPLAF